MTKDARLKIAIVVGIALLVAIWFVATAKKEKPVEAKADAAPIVPEPSASVVIAPVVEEAAVPAPGTPSQCDVIAAANRTVFAPAIDAADLGVPTFPCTTLGDAMWTFRIRSAAVTGGNEVTYNLTTVRIVDGGTAEEDAGLKHLHAYYSVMEPTVHRLVDYGGDGSEEVAIDEYTHGHESSPTHLWRVLTVRGADVLPYAPAAKITVTGIEDIDGDGRPDLATRGPYEKVHYVSGLPTYYPIAPMWFVHHSRPDGTFALDAASQAYALKKCPAKPTLALAGGGNGSPDAETIVCAKLWSVPAADILKAIDAVCSPDAAFDECRHWELELAKIAPPFTLK